MAKVIVPKIEDRPFRVDGYVNFLEFCEYGKQNCSVVGVQTPTGQKCGFYRNPVMNHPAITNLGLQSYEIGNLYIDNFEPHSSKALAFLTIENKGSYHNSIIVPARFRVEPPNLWLPRKNSINHENDELYRSGEIFQTKRELSPEINEYYDIIDVSDKSVDNLVNSAEDIISKGIFEKNVRNYQMNLKTLVDEACKNNSTSENLWQYLVKDFGRNPYY